MKPRKGIHRVVHTQSRTKAWTAIIARASGSARRMFSDGVYGGSLEAYRAASAWYQETLPLYPLKTRVQRMSKLRRNNRSGITGVYRWPANGSNVPDAYWAAQWVIEPWQKPKRRKYSIASHGERQAKQLAIKARKDAIDALLSAQA